MTDQTAKQDTGKLDLTLVPRQIIWDIAEVRQYAVQHKYKNPDNWKQVEIGRYKAAAFRHFLAYLEDPEGKDAESGIEHYKHLCCNLIHFGIAVVYTCKILFKRSLIIGSIKSCRRRKHRTDPQREQNSNYRI